MRKSNDFLLGQQDVGKSLFSLAFPSFLSMLISTLYNVVDTIFVGHSVGPLGIAGVAVALPVTTIITALHVSVSNGSSSIISRCLGAQQIEKAREAFGNLLVMLFIIALVTVSTGFLWDKSIITLFGAAGEVKSYAMEYYHIVLVGTPFLGFAMMGSTASRGEGNPRIGLFAMIVSTVLNTVLDAIFILGMNMGLQGAALATVISQIVFALQLAFYFGGKKSLFSLLFNYWKLKASLVRESVTLGSATFARQGATNIIVGVVNNSLLIYGGVQSVAIYGIIYRIVMVSRAPAFGLVQGLLPLAGYSYGAKNYERLREVWRTAAFSTIVIGIMCVLGVELFAEDFVRMFTSDAALIEKSSLSLRVMTLSLPFMAFQMLGTGYFQAVGLFTPALVLSLARQVILIISLQILPKYFGIEGIFGSFPVSDFLAMSVTLSLLFPF
ncbi:MATE family efflux transporter, partial [Xanthovirga aplysinae]|uniref:MATE family efflux transporter n=1 Tax=Xanthovirga aplysinae TaxID=2529853 RepID=UPI0012BBDE2E